MMLKGQDASHIVVGNSFSEDGHAGRTFDYCLANPPFGVEWKKVEDEVKKEHEQLGFRGRFGAGLPRINDGSFLFLQHMIAKMKPISQGGSRIAIVFNGSPLFTGAAGSGESEIRRWIIENDWLDAVVALPDQLFYNTGISTYFWIVSNRKSEERRGKVQLIDAREYFEKTRKALGEKRKEIGEEQIAEVTRLYAAFTEGDHVKVFPNEVFGYMRITVERPLRAEWRPAEFSTQLAKSDSEQWMKDRETELTAALAKIEVSLSNRKKAEVAIKMAAPELIAKEVRALVNMIQVESDRIVVDAKGNVEPDANLRDNENVPLPATPIIWANDVTARLETDEYRRAVDQYVTVEVLPYVKDVWVDYDKTKIGYEVLLTRYFYRYIPPRPLAEIDAEIKALEVEIQALLSEVTE